MTREYLREANKINHAISDLEAQIAIIEDILHSDTSLRIGNNTYGEITLDENTKMDVIDIVLRNLNMAKEAKEDELRMM